MYFSSEQHRKWIRVYVTPKTKAGYPFIKFRVNHPMRYKYIANWVVRNGYRVNAIYYEVYRKSDNQQVYNQRIL